QPEPLYRLRDGEVGPSRDYWDDFYEHESEKANHEYYVGFSLNGPNGDFVFPEAGNIREEQLKIKAGTASASTSSVDTNNPLGLYPDSGTGAPYDSETAKREGEVLSNPKEILNIPVKKFSVPFAGTPLSLSRDGGQITLNGLDWNEDLVDLSQQGVFQLFLIFEFSMVSNNLQNEEHPCFYLNRLEAKCNRPFMYDEALLPTVSIPLTMRAVLDGASYQFALPFNVTFADVNLVTSVFPKYIPMVRDSAEAWQSSYPVSDLSTQQTQ
ncbi:unnamed protein product, partial [Amoebophrya sp. A120]